MKTFIIGIVGIIIASLITLFVPSYYAYSWGYADFEGIIGDTAYSKSDKVYYSLVDAFGGLAYIVFAITVIGLLLYTILILTKNSNLVPLPLIFLLAIFPIIMVIIGAIQAMVGGEYIKTGSLIVGSGVNSGITGWGILCLVVLILFYCITAKGFTLVKKQVEAEGATQVKTISVKKKKNSNNIDENNFSL
jgi:hypothetical protein